MTTRIDPIERMCNATSLEQFLKGVEEYKQELPKCLTADQATRIKEAFERGVTLASNPEDQDVRAFLDNAKAYLEAATPDNFIAEVQPILLSRIWQDRLVPSAAAATVTTKTTKPKHSVHWDPSVVDTKVKVLSIPRKFSLMALKLDKGVAAGTNRNVVLDMPTFDQESRVENWGIEKLTLLSPYLHPESQESLEVVHLLDNLLTKNPITSLILSSVTQSIMDLFKDVRKSSLQLIIIKNPDVGNLTHLINFIRNIPTDERPKVCFVKSQGPIMPPSETLKDDIAILKELTNTEEITELALVPTKAVPKSRSSAATPAFRLPATSAVPVPKAATLPQVTPEAPPPVRSPSSPAPAPEAGEAPRRGFWRTLLSAPLNLIWWIIGFFIPHR